MRVPASLIVLAGLLTALPATAAAPTIISTARVYRPDAASRTVAIVRPESGSAEADAALEEGLRGAGLTVVAPTDRPQLLVSYFTNVRGMWGFFPNGSHAGSVSVPRNAVNDNFSRRTTVVAWEAGAPRPTASSVVWLTQLRSDGLSSEPKQFLPNMLRAGAGGYGRTVEPPYRPMRG